MIFKKLVKNFIVKKISHKNFLINLLKIYKIKSIRRLIEIPPVYKVKKSNIYLKTIDNVQYHKDIFWLGLQSKKDYFTIHLLETLIKTSKIYWDIGADSGIDSIFPSVYNENCEIFAFEPIPGSFDILKQNIKLNKIGNIQPYNIALSNHTGQMPFYIDINSSVSSGLNPTANAKKILIEGYTGDDFVIKHKVGIPDLIKIDVEGFESEILSCMQNILNKKPILIVEVLSDLFGKKIEEQLPNNYIFFQINDDLNTLEQVSELKRKSRNNINFLLITNNDLDKIKEFIN